MHRHALRDDQWIRIKDFLRAATAMSVGLPPTIACSWMPSSSAIARAFPGVICQSVSAMVSPSTGAIADGA